MKRTTKIIAGMTLTWVLLSLGSTGVSAADQQRGNQHGNKQMMMDKSSNNTMSRGNSENQRGDKSQGEMLDFDFSDLTETKQEEVEVLFEEFKEDGELINADFQEDLDELKEDYKSELELLKENVDDDIDEDEKSELIEEFNELKDEYQTTRELIQAENSELMQELYAEYKEELIDVVGEDHSIIVQLEERELKMQEMKEKIAEQKENNQDRTEKKNTFKENSSEKISKYKSAYSDKIQWALANISTERLTEFNEQLLDLFDKVEESESMSDENKEMMLARITALQEIIEDILNQNNFDLDIDELLEIEL